MTRQLNVEADSLEEALRRLLAELAGTSEEEVKVSIEAQGLLERQGVVRLAVEVGAEAPGPGEAAEDVKVEEDDEEEEEEPAVTVDQLDEEADAAADFLEGLLDAMDLPGDIQIRVHEDHAEVEIVNVGSGRLIGRRGQTLDAIQELMRCALQRQFERRARVMVDIEGYRSRRLERLLEKAQEAVDAVLAEGDAQRLEPMDAFERKAVHRFVASREGVTSGSRGREPTRRVVIERE
ncbi:MAG: KH domain-containing protein [Actinomycetota bacterium]|nr:KH domain-containing protein [Actinomycetota bacterium]